MNERLHIDDFTIKVLSQDEEILKRLSSKYIEIDLADRHKEQFHTSETKYVPGAIGGWYELAINFGLIALPASILASSIANWISNSLKDRAPDNTSAKIIIRQGEFGAQIELEDANNETILEALDKVLNHVDTK